MSVRHLSESLNSLFGAKLEEFAALENITWELLIFPGVQMGQNGQPVMGPPKGVLYLSMPSPILGSSPITLGGEIGKDLVQLNDEDVYSLILEMLEALRNARTQMLALENSKNNTKQ